MTSSSGTATRHGAQGRSDRDDIAEAALAGWLQSDGFVGQYEHGTNRSLIVEAMTVTDAEHEWVSVLPSTPAFPRSHRKDRQFETMAPDLDGHRIRLYGETASRRSSTPGDSWPEGSTWSCRNTSSTAPLPVVAAYLRSMFQAEGYVSAGENAAIVGLDHDLREARPRRAAAACSVRDLLASSPQGLIRGLTAMDVWSLAIRPLADRQRFGEEIGFVDWTKGEQARRGLWSFRRRRPAT